MNKKHLAEAIRKQAKPQKDNMMKLTIGIDLSSLKEVMEKEKAVEKDE